MHDLIAKKAHQLWEAEGCPHGRDQEHWDRAAALVAMEQVKPAAPKAAPKKTAAEPAKTSPVKAPAKTPAAAKAPVARKKTV